MKTPLPFLPQLSAGVLAVATGLSGHGAVSTWSGNASVASWSSPANWSNNTLPPAANDVKFGSGYASGKTITLSGSRTVNNLIFDNATGVTLVGSGGLVVPPGGWILTLNGGQVTASTYGDVTIDSRLHLAVGADFNVASSTRLSLKRPITGAPPPPGGGLFHVGMSKSGDGELVLDATNTFGGALRVDKGKLTAARSAALPYTIVYLHGKFFSTPSELHLNAYVTPTVGYLIMDREALITGASTAALNIAGATLNDHAVVDAVLTGPGNVLVAADADAHFERDNTFTGNITVATFGKLTVDRDASLGEVHNSIEFEGYGDLNVDDGQGLTSHSRTLSVPTTSSEAHLALNGELGCHLSGPGAVVIKPDGFGAIDLAGGNSGFTGTLFTNKKLRVTASGAFGNAAGIVLENSKSIEFHEDIDAPNTDLTTSSGSSVTLNNRDVTLKDLRVGLGSDTTVVLSNDSIDATLDLDDIVFIGASGNLKITGWAGNTLASTGDKVLVGHSLSSSELDRITINGQPVRRLNGELVLKP